MPMSVLSSAHSVSRVGTIDSILIEWRIDHSSLPSTDRLCELTRKSSFRSTSTHAVFRDLQRRGCPRTAFEYARLLVSLEPLSDPHGVYLHLDYLCVKAGLGDWLLDAWTVYRSTPYEDSGEYIDPSVLPGWSYARALILRAKEKEKKERGEVPLLC